MLLSEIRQEYDRRCGEKKSISDTVARMKTRLKELNKREKHIRDAQTLVQEVAKQTQSELEYSVSSLVTDCMQSVFEEDIEMKLDFVTKRGATEADVLLKDESGNCVRPRDSDGAGLVDIMSFGLRMVMFSLSEKARPLFIMDEPFKKLNDPSRNMHRRAADMVKSLSEELGVQIIIVTLLPELGKSADKEFLVEKQQGEPSTVTVL